MRQSTGTDQPCPASNGARVSPKGTIRSSTTQSYALTCSSTSASGQSAAQSTAKPPSRSPAAVISRRSSSSSTSSTRTGRTPPIPGLGQTPRRGGRGRPAILGGPSGANGPGRGPMATAHVMARTREKADPASVLGRHAGPGPLFPGPGHRVVRDIPRRMKAKGISFLHARFFDIPARRRAGDSRFSCSAAVVASFRRPSGTRSSPVISSPSQGRGLEEGLRTWGPSLSRIEKKPRRLYLINARASQERLAIHMTPGGVVPEAAVLIDPVRAMDTEADVTHPVGIDMVHRTRSQDAFPRDWMRLEHDRFSVTAVLPHDHAFFAPLVKRSPRPAPGRGSDAAGGHARLPRRVRRTGGTSLPAVGPGLRVPPGASGRRRRPRRNRCRGVLLRPQVACRAAGGGARDLGGAP